MLPDLFLRLFAPFFDHFLSLLQIGGLGLRLRLELSRSRIMAKGYEEWEVIRPDMPMTDTSSSRNASSKNT